jgi:hypothetical protein
MSLIIDVNKLDQGSYAPLKSWKTLDKCFNKKYPRKPMEFVIIPGKHK